MRIYAFSVNGGCYDKQKSLFVPATSRRENGLIKVITGIRRLGKYFLLFEIYKNYLLPIGVEEKYIVGFALDETPNANYRNPFELDL